MQGRERPKGRLQGPSRRKGRGPGGSSPKAEHPRFPVNVADLARLEMGPSGWTGTGRATTFIIGVGTRRGVIPGRTYEDLRAQAPEAARPLLDSVRAFCMALGDDVVEDVRMHRVVFCKTVSFRWFADVEPSRDGVVVKIQRGRSDPPQRASASDAAQAEGLQAALRDAYKSIR